MVKVSVLKRHQCVILVKAGIVTGRSATKREASLKEKCFNEFLAAAKQHSYKDGVTYTDVTVDITQDNAWDRYNAHKREIMNVITPAFLKVLQNNPYSKGPSGDNREAILLKTRIFLYEKTKAKTGTSRLESIVPKEGESVEFCESSRGELEAEQTRVEIDNPNNSREQSSSTEAVMNELPKSDDMDQPRKRMKSATIEKTDPRASEHFPIPWLAFVEYGEAARLFDKAPLPEFERQLSNGPAHRTKLAEAPFNTLPVDSETANLSSVFTSSELAEPTSWNRKVQRTKEGLEEHRNGTSNSKSLDQDMLKAYDRRTAMLLEIKQKELAMEWRKQRIEEVKFFFNNAQSPEEIAFWKQVLIEVAQKPISDDLFPRYPSSEAQHSSAPSNL